MTARTGRARAIGIALFAGVSSVQSATNTGSGRIALTIERALIPGSKMPKPPGSQIHSCPGCQRRTFLFPGHPERGDRLA